MLLSTLLSAVFIVFFGKSHTLLAVTAIAHIVVKEVTAG
jgi:hypothetical protein